MSLEKSASTSLRTDHSEATKYSIKTRYVTECNTKCDTEHDDARQRRARLGLLLFFSFLIPLTALFEGLIIVTQSVFWGLFHMWSPALASIATRLILHEGVKDISFRLSGRRAFSSIAVAILVPVGVALLAYGVTWIAGFNTLTPFHASSSLAIFLSLPGPGTPLVVEICLALIFLTAVEMLAATGEELGWRGYMLTRLIEANVPAPIVASGVIWSLWHWPLILLSSPDSFWHRFTSACIFLVTITSLGCLSARLRLKSGSIWPSVVLHATWNACIVEVFASINRPGSFPWTGESGVLVALIMAIVACLSLSFRL